MTNPDQHPSSHLHLHHQRVLSGDYQAFLRLQYTLMSTMYYLSCGIFQDNELYTVERIMPFTEQETDPQDLQLSWLVLILHLLGHCPSACEDAFLFLRDQVLHLEINYV